MSSFWIFTLCLASIVWTLVEGQSKVIGSSQPIIASPGDDVILPCHLNPEFNVQELTVEWSKPDLKPDPSDRLSRVAYVHLYRGGREVPDMKNPVYMSRTELFEDQLVHGNISLKILNVTLADEGRFRCLVPKLKNRVKYAIVQLVVESNSDQTSTTEPPLDDRNLQTPDPMEETDVKGFHPSRSVVISVVVVTFIFLMGAAVCAYLFKRYCQKTDNSKYDKVHTLSKPLPV